MIEFAFFEGECGDVGQVETGELHHMSVVERDFFCLRRGLLTAIVREGICLSTVLLKSAPDCS